MFLAFGVIFINILWSAFLIWHSGAKLWSEDLGIWLILSVNFLLFIFLFHVDFFRWLYPSTMDALTCSHDYQLISRTFLMCCRASMMSLRQNFLRREQRWKPSTRNYTSHCIQRCIHLFYCGIIKVWLMWCTTIPFSVSAFSFDARWHGKQLFMHFVIIFLTQLMYPVLQRSVPFPWLLVLYLNF